MPKAIITKAQESDYKKIHKLLMHEKVNPFMNYPLISQEEFHQNIWPELVHKTHVWKVDEEILAFAVITKGSYRIRHLAYIDILVANQEVERKGVGRAFLIELISELTEERFAKVELGVEVDNKRAVSFYEKLGFFIEGTRQKLLNRDGEFVDNYYMAKWL